MVCCSCWTGCDDLLSIAEERFSEVGSEWFKLTSRRHLRFTFYFTLDLAFFDCIMARSEEAQAWSEAVYAAVQEIPHGRFTTYGHIASLLGERTNFCDAFWA